MKANAAPRRLTTAPAVTLLAAAIGAACLTLPASATAASLKEANAESPSADSESATTLLENARALTAKSKASTPEQAADDDTPDAGPNDLPRGQFHLPEEGDVIGKQYTVTVKDQEQTLVDIARKHNIGYEEMRMANPGVSLWVPGEGTEVNLPSRYILPDVKREGIVINLSELRLYYYPANKPGIVETYPVSVGREEFATPVGVTKTTQKVKDPAWAPPASMRREAAERGEPAPEVVPAGPDNPLGRHAILLGLPSYLIHGTNRPEGVGMRVSRGCIRMYPEDIESLYERLPGSTRVNIIDAPFKAGWDSDGSLLVQSFPQLEENSEDFEPLLNALEIIEAKTGEDGVEIDYKRVKQAIEDPDGSILALSGPQAEAPRESDENRNTATLLKNLQLKSRPEEKGDAAD
ncbi:L,D-transpeptidase family protein [Halomonas piscis]|uniref:L,D-transpeptidase family protein n=1 Tax=Halomonas piscis TaxID=3031727 RepID=A0ABY9YXE7_9GAMM|nr:L,D-transpeptidase family protein [Halomonas piscis]WNK19130.1 L,D-transpeptidase family protein [Halomonas piscis]